MKFEYLLAEAMLNGQTESVLTSVGEALTEVMERNRVNSTVSVDEASKRNEVFGKAATLVYQARNLFR